MRHLIWILLAALASLPACGGDDDGGSDADGDADTDADTDADSDSDGDTDTDADADTDTDTDTDSDTDTDADTDSDTDTDADTDSDSDGDCALDAPCTEDPGFCWCDFTCGADSYSVHCYAEGNICDCWEGAEYGSCSPSVFTTPDICFEDNCCGFPT